MSSKGKKVIVLTGFGPFGKHEVNASWRAVSAVRDGKMWQSEDFELLVEEIPVLYDFVRSEVPTRWKRKCECDGSEVCAVVHVGVSGIADCLTLETVAHNDGYKKLDVDKKCPDDSRCVKTGCEILKTAFDVEKLVERVNRSGALTGGVRCVSSSDAGRYLCEFSFYKSMHDNDARALFVHVPDLGKPYTADQLARSICVVLDGIAEWIGERR